MPSVIWDRLSLVKRRWVTRDDARLSTREVFSRIYREGIWGPADGFSSGSGSDCAEIVDPYVERIRQWANEHQGQSLVAVDLGCGDFRVGNRIFTLFKHYIAADIVPDLIQHHKANHQEPNLEFHCVDAIEDELPTGDVVFVRQVLQHLSNVQVGKILGKLKNYGYLIITEHLPAEGQLKVKNADKVHGGKIRMNEGSGLYLEDPPFSLSALESQILLEVPGGINPVKDGVIRTTVYRMG